MPPMRPASWRAPICFMTEVNTFISDIIEDGLVAVALILDVTDLHLQAQVHGNLARADHGILLTGLGLLVAFHIRRFGLAEDAQYLSVFTQVHALHLVLDQTARESHTTDVVPGVGLDGHPVALLEGDVGAVAVESAARVLEEHLDNVKLIVGHLGEPVGAREVASPQVVSAGTTASASTTLHAGVGTFRRIDYDILIVLIHCGTLPFYLA